MARVLATKVKVSKKKGQKKKPPKRPETDVVESVRVVRTKASEFATIGPSHSYWGSGAEGLDDRAGDFVRVRPPSFATDREIAGLKAWLEANGATVALEPKEVAESVLPLDAEVSDVDTPRQAVLELVETSNCADRRALREFCEEVMDRCGL